jgi:hypothetical protein
MMRACTGGALTASLLLASWAMGMSCVPTPPVRVEAGRGRLENFSRQPVASARVQFFAASRSRNGASWRRFGRALISASTDSEGKFDFSRISPGTYFVEIKAGDLERTLLLAMTPRSADASHEVRLRLLGVECNAVEVSSLP